MSVDTQLRLQERQTTLTCADEIRPLIKELLRAGRRDDALPLIHRAFVKILKSDPGYKVFLERVKFLDEQGIEWYLVGSRIYKYIHDIIYCDFWSKERSLDWDVLVINYYERRQLPIEFPDETRVMGAGPPRITDYSSRELKLPGLKIDFITATDLGLYGSADKKLGYAQAVPLSIQSILYSCAQDKLYDYFSISSIIDRKISLNAGYSDSDAVSYFRNKLYKKSEFYKFR